MKLSNNKKSNVYKSNVKKYISNKFSRNQMAGHGKRAADDNYSNDNFSNDHYSNNIHNNNSNFNSNSSNNNKHTYIESSSASTLKPYLAWGGVVLWMILIFYLSHQPATESSELSRGVLSVVLGFIQRISPNLARELELLQLNYLLRKNAHFIAYLVLAVLTMNALAQNQVHGKRQVLYAFLICLLYAITDEVHQLFIPGRSGEVKDVLLDSVGALTGILLYRIPAVFRQLKAMN